MCWESFEGSLFSRLRKVSTVLATVAVKNVSCLGRSSDREIRRSNVPVYSQNSGCPVTVTEQKMAGQTLKDGMSSWAMLLDLDCWESLVERSWKRPSESPS